MLSPPDQSAHGRSLAMELDAVPAFKPACHK